MENAGTTGVIPNASNTKKPDRMSGFFIVEIYCFFSIAAYSLYRIESVNYSIIKNEI